MTCGIKIVDSRLSKLPEYQTKEAAGADLRICLDGPTRLQPGGTMLLGTGIALELEPGNAGLILPRSGLGHNYGIVLGNTVGLIDSDYRGEIKISCHNRSDKEYLLLPNERIAQLVIIPIKQVSFTVLDTERGEGGFGSTNNNEEEDNNE